jgi:hypothetical protein
MREREREREKEREQRMNRMCVGASDKGMASKKRARDSSGGDGKERDNTTEKRHRGADDKKEGFSSQASLSS